MTGELMQMASSFGAPGLLIAFMIWDRKEQNKINRERIQADLDMARSLTLLSAKLDHVR